MASKAAAKAPASTRKDKGHDEFSNLSWFVAFTAYLSYSVLIVFGHLRDAFGKLTKKSRYFGLNAQPKKVGCRGKLLCTGSADG